MATPTTRVHISRQDSNDLSDFADPFIDTPGKTVLVKNDFADASLALPLARLVALNGDSRILFSETVQKVSRSGNLKEKTLVLSDKAVYLLDYPALGLHKQIFLQDISQLKLSHHHDGFLAIILREAAHDLLVVSGRRADLAAAIACACGRAAAPEIVRSDAFTYRLGASAEREVASTVDASGAVRTALRTAAAHGASSRSPGDGSPLSRTRAEVPGTAADDPEQSPGRQSVSAEE